MKRETINLWGFNTIAKQLLSPILLGALMFALAGTTEWTWGWIFNILHFLVWAGMTLALVLYNPELLNIRGRRQQGTKGWDNVLLGIYGLAWIAMIAVAAVDVRYGWTAPFPVWLRVVGAVLMVAGFALTTWGMVVNRHFEGTVRLQTERNHAVIKDGPYQYVRHPGYTGVVTSFFIGMPLVLSSLPAFIPALIGAVVIIVRTAKEDRTLQAELPGYDDFMQQTRYRLLPGVW